MDQTSWGSREGADADDAFRLMRLPRYDEHFAGPSDPDNHIRTLLLDSENEQEEETKTFPMNSDRYEHPQLPPYSEREQAS